MQKLTLQRTAWYGVSGVVTDCYALRSALRLHAYSRQLDVGAIHDLARDGLFAHAPFLFLLGLLCSFLFLGCQDRLLPVLFVAFLFPAHRFFLPVVFITVGENIPRIEVGKYAAPWQQALF